MDLEPQPFSHRLKVASFFIFILLLLLVVPARWFGIGSESYQKSTGPDISPDLLVQNVNDDSDHDGIPNWKESLMGTNPMVKDATKVKVTEAPKSPEEKKALARLDDPKNLTSQFIKNTVGLSTYLDKQGVTDEAELKQISNNIGDETAKIAEVRTYASKDLNISNNESLESLKLYGNKMALGLINMFFVVDPTNGITDLQEYQKNNDASKLKKYEIKVNYLNELINAMTKTPVPASAVETHLYVLNTYEIYRVVLLGFSESANDPMRGMLSAKSYPDAYYNITQCAVAFATYFSKKSVVFGPNESASIFTKISLIK